ncbi:mediator of RNA polymerase II transcription subunit 28-like [Forsythia ovata]|uniref:Mediator of RNA polymerase II transcription subunit 28-like n=1 Tax=Forsythia ovata TaxID=205694 RepID=A0ABD1T4L8_9LAMI
MAERQLNEPQHVTDAQLQSPPATKEDMISYVVALEACFATVLTCKRTPSNRPFIPILLTRLMWRDTLEILWRQPKSFSSILLVYNARISPPEQKPFRRRLPMMEEELKLKTEVINRQERLIQGWREELKEQLHKHTTELERVVTRKTAAMLIETLILNIHNLQDTCFECDGLVN